MDTAHGAASTAAAAAKTVVVGDGADVVECIFVIEIDTAHGAASTAAAAAKTVVVGAGADVVECIFDIEEQSQEIGSRRIDRLHGPVPDFAAWSPEH